MILLDILANSILVLLPFSFALFDKVFLGRFSPRTVKRAWQMLEARVWMCAQAIYGQQWTRPILFASLPFLNRLDEREYEYKKPRGPPHVEPFLASLDHLVYAAQNSAISLIRLEYDEDILNKAPVWHSRSFGPPASTVPFEALVQSFHSLLATPFGLREAVYQAMHQKLLLPIVSKTFAAASPSALSVADAYCRCVFTAHLAASLGSWVSYKRLVGLLPMLGGELDDHAITPPWLDDDDALPQYFRTSTPPAYEAFLDSSHEATWSSDDSATVVLAFADFVNDFTAYNAAALHDTSLLKLSLTLQPRLMADASRKAAVRAEERLHEAILDAVLARRNLETALEDEAAKA
ncbi:hypothetical protein JCM10207_003681 [Rhodosporidiobolus poonsookiae]